MKKIEVSAETLLNIRACLRLFSDLYLLILDGTIPLKYDEDIEIFDEPQQLASNAMVMLNFLLGLFSDQYSLKKNLLH